MSSTPRLVPDEPFPPYAFVPGRFPHPESDPQGHSFGRYRAPAAALDPGRWSESRPYLLGLDFFNAGYYWESHVEFESLWLAAGRKGVVADFLKGLIQLAAAGVKHLEGVPAGITNHARRAAELWQSPTPIRNDEPLLGLQLPELISLAQSIADNGWPKNSPVLLPSPRPA